MTSIVQFPVPIPVTNGNLPQFKFAIFGDNLSTVTTAGYLNAAAIQAGIPLSNADVIMALYSFNTQTQSGTFGIFTVSIAASNGQITLTQWANSGDAVLPTTANYLAHFTNTTGTISSGAGNVTQPGNISAGLSGTAGTVSSFPSTASRGSLILTAVANTGNTTTTISNAAMGQASVVSIPDPGASTANFVVSTTAGGQTIAGGLTISTGNLGVTLGNITAAAGNISATAGSLSAGTTVTAGTGVTATTGNITASAGNVVAGASGAAGTVTSFPSTAANGSLIVAATNAGGAFNTTISNGTMGQSTVYTIPDIGAATGDVVVSTAAVRMKSVAGAAAAGGAADQSFTDTFCTSGSNVIGNWNTQANAASVLKIVPGNGSFVVTSSADAGVGTFNYIIMK